MRFTAKDIQVAKGAKSAAPPPSAPPLFEVPRPAHLNKKKNKNEPEALVFYANGQTLSQRLHRAPAGQVGWRDAPVGGAPASSPTKNPYGNVVATDHGDHRTVDFISSATTPSHPTTNSVKKQKQCAKWTSTVIPRLVPIFIELFYETQGLRDTTRVELRDSTDCECKKRVIYVAVVRWNVIEHRRVCFCNCRPAANVLLGAGLFPCSPVLPSLAVDISVLDFAMRLFVNMTPNNTAFSNTLEGFLISRGYKLTNKDTLRVRFGNALEWYTSLQHATQAQIDELLDIVRESVIGPSIVPPEEQPPASPSVPHAPSTPSQSRSSVPDPQTPTTPRPVPPPPSEPKKRKQRAKAGKPEEAHPNPFPDPPPRARPSDYLIQRCPACFGGLVHDPTADVDIHVSADACFTQKRRRKGARDPPRTHPQTVFVPERTADQMGAHVEDVRPVRDTSKRARVEEEDCHEHQNLRVPRSVLDECRESFIAADEKREKASTKFFEDTGVMGLMCRHDRVLWLVNMRTAGEKQYYVLVLIETLFQHLPANIRVGILYDIACQLHRSCCKYKFMERYMDRMIFAVSVFHAFGHRWPCQLIYHPMKCCGFGHTNGEGCERFWHSISKLIAYLRVAGYHLRLYTIDSQIQHMDKMSQGRLGSWILRRTQHCETKEREAIAELKACAVETTVLRAQWADQVRVQTQPLKSQSKTAAQQAVERIIESRNKANQLFDRVKHLEETLANPDATAEASLYAEMHVEEARKAWRAAIAKTAQLKRTLGVEDTTVVEKLKHSEYYTARMNARAVKERLRAKLRDRKFELDPIERSVRRSRSENQRNEHAGAAIKRREPGINRLAQTYNKLCGTIATLIAAKKAPRHAVAPLEVPTKGLYQLDVDDVIWQDLGLDESESAPPLWLSDDNVRSGIRAMLMMDRCKEEGARLVREHTHLLVWFRTEWETVTLAMESSEDDALRYQMERRREELLQLCVLWRRSLDRIPLSDENDGEWGPTDEEIVNCEIAAVTAAWGDGVHEEPGAEDFEEEEEIEEEDEELYYVVSAVERADNHRGDDEGLSWDDGLDD